MRRFLLAVIISSFAPLLAQTQNIYGGDWSFGFANSTVPNVIGIGPPPPDKCNLNPSHRGRTYTRLDPSNLTAMVYICAETVYGNGIYQWNLQSGTGGGGGGGTIPSTTGALRGDGAGNALAVTGTGTNCVLVNGGSGTCGGGSGISGLTPTVLPKATSSTTIGDSTFSDNGTTASTTLPFAAPSLALGTSPPAVTFGTGGGWIGGEGTAPTGGFPAAAVDGCYFDATSHKILCSFNNDTPLAMTRSLPPGTATLATSAIGPNACATAVSVTATGALTSDVIQFTPTANLAAVTGYGAGASDGLVIYPFPTADHVNFQVCNITGTSITPGAATLNWKIQR